MNLSGNMNLFDREHDDITEYIERIELYFYANGITEKTRQIALLLLAVGGEAYSLLRNLVAPGTSARKCWRILCNALIEHFQLDLNILDKRFKFYSRKQKIDETVAGYISALHQLSVDCMFGKNVSTVLRDQFIYGLNRRKIKGKLLAKNVLTLKENIEFAKRLENEEIEGENNEIGLKKRSVLGQKLYYKTKCDHCFSELHQSTNCRFLNISCYKCNKKGHLGKICENVLPLIK